MSSFIVETATSPITENIVDKSNTDKALSAIKGMSNTNIAVALALVVIAVFIIYYFAKQPASKKKSVENNVMEVEVQKLRDFQASLINMV